MKKIISLILALLMLVSLTACQEQETDVRFTEVSSVDAVSQQLGYDMLTIDSKDDAITWSTGAFLCATGEDKNDAVGQLTYVSGKSTIDLRMTMDEERGTGLAGYENAGYAGSVEAPKGKFSELNINVIHSDLFYCEFSYTREKYTAYLSLSKNKTDLDSFSKLLISFVNQLNDMKETPDFALQEQRKAEVQADLEAAAQAHKDAEAAAQGQTQPQTVIPVIPEPDPVEPTPSEPAPTPVEPEQPTGAIELEYYDMTFRPNEGYTLHPKGGTEPYTWKSADQSIATVTAEGTITTHAVGQTTLTCTDKNGVTAEVIIRVVGSY